MNYLQVEQTGIQEFALEGRKNRQHQHLGAFTLLNATFLKSKVGTKLEKVTVSINQLRREFSTG